MQTGFRLRVMPGRYAVCRLPSSSPVPAAEGAWVSVTRTPDELSMVCAESAAPAGARIEDGWIGLAVQGPLPFTATGVLAAIATPLADAAVSIFVVSTFDTDYVFVKQAQLRQAADALGAAGHTVLR